MAARRWKRESTHGNECRRCNEAAANAKTNAILNGAQSCTYHAGEHTATMHRPGTN